MTISIIGAGAFGTSLAVALSDQPVLLWTRDRASAEEMNATRQNARRLPNIALPDSIQITSDIDDLLQCETILLSVPTQTLGMAIETLPEWLGDKALVACCKGLDLTTGLRPTETLRRHFPNAKIAVLTGPSFAEDIGRGLPTALTLACENASDAEVLQERLSCPTLRLYRSTDCIGAELGGALKNVIAIAAGAAMGAKLGESARASVMTRGFAEIRRLALKLGAEEATLFGLSGFGDLVLTCGSPKSRNFRYGFSLGANTPFDLSTTVEGVSTAKAALAQAKAHDIDMPITEMVVALMDGQTTVSNAVESLFARPLKEE